MSTTKYVVRSDAGGLARGVIGSDAAVLSPAVGDEISLNLQVGQVLSYMRSGSDLKITLVNGEVITIAGFFDDAGAPIAELYLSSAGALSEVEFSAGEGALLNAGYVQADPFAKWSPDDALYFVDDGALVLDGVEDVAAGLPLGLIGLGAAGLLGAGLVAQSGSGVASSDSGDSDDVPAVTPSAPSVGILEGTKENGDLVSADDHEDGVTISGTATPNADGTITIGDVTKDITVTPDGEWTATFDPDEVLPGEYETDVVVTVTTDDGATTEIGTVVVDTLVDVTFDPDTVEGDGHIDGDDVVDGVTLEGTTDADATVEVAVGDETYPADVGDDGTWTVTIPADDIDPADTTLDVVVTATDPAGNTDTVSGTVPVDTTTTVTIDTSGAGGDGVVNEVEHPDGVAVSGVAEPGASVVVTLGDATQTVGAGDDGAWTVTFPSDDVPTGALEVPVTAVSTDPHGNEVTATGTVLIDTDINVGIDDQAEGIVNAIERADGITLTGSADAGADVVVEFNGVVNTGKADESGQWSVDVAPEDIPEGELIVPVDVTATDPAGNVAMVSSVVEIDTTMMLSFDAGAVEGDGIVNAVEHADGVTLSGQSQGGASVAIDFNGSSQTVMTGDDGHWTADFAAGDIATGTYAADIAITATDAAGNAQSISDTLAIDTELGLSVSFDQVAGDGVINAVERDAGVDLSGTTDAGASIVVTLGGVSMTTQADDTGAWSVTYSKDDIPVGETSLAASVTAQDAAGNTASTSGTVLVDTIVDPLASSDAPVEGDDIVNAAEASDGITLNGTVEVGSTVMVTFQDTTRAATVADDGTWTASFAGAEVPPGTYDATVSIQATDAAGNTATITDVFSVDTEAPDAPNIESFVKGEGGLRGFGIEDAGDDITVAEFVEGADTATPVDLGSGGFENPITGEMNFGFAGGHEVPNGSHLIVTAGDDAGNTNSTFFVLDDSTGASAIDVTAGALDGFNIGAIDLELFAEEASVTISADDIAALSGNDNALIINGKGDDTVQLNGAATVAGTQVIDGHDYTVYDVDGGAAQLIIRDEIEFQQSII